MSTIKRSSRQRKALRYQEHSNELFCDAMRIATMARLGLMTEHQVTDLKPARITALKDMYLQDKSQGQEWSGDDRVSEQFIASLLNYQEPLQKCPIYNVEAEEFVPPDVEPQFAEEKTLSSEECYNFEETEEIEPLAQHLQCVVEEEVQTTSVCDSGYATPVVTKMLTDVAKRLDQPTSIEEIQFGNIPRDDFIRLTSPPNLDDLKAVDFLSDAHTSDGVVVVMAPKEATANDYYTPTPLGDLLAHADSSILVRSLVGRDDVAEQRRILSAVRPRVAKLIADAEILNPGYKSSALVNSLADHCYTTTGRIFGNPVSRRRLSLYLNHLRQDLHLRRLGKYLPDSPEYGSYIAAPRVRLKR